MPVDDDKAMSLFLRFRPHVLAALIGAAVLLLWAGAMVLVMRDAALPEESAGTVMAVFPPGMSQEHILAAVIRADGRPMRALWPGNVWIANGAEAGFAGRLRQHGAMQVYGELPMGPVMAGCFAYVDSALPLRSGMLPKP